MSSSTIIHPGPLRGHSRYFEYEDGLATTKADADELRVIWDLTDYLTGAETVSSATYADHGAVTSSKTVVTPQILFTVTGLGYTTVTATLSTSRTVEQKFYFLGRDGSGATDYQS